MCIRDRVTGWGRLSIDDDGVAVDKPGCLVGEPAEVGATVRAIRDAGIEHLTMYAAAADDPSPLPALTEAYLDRFAPFLEAIRAA